MCGVRGKNFDLVDMARVQRLADLFASMTGARICLLSPDGSEICVSAGEDDFCGAFYLSHPDSSRLCGAHMKKARESIAAGKAFSFKCHAGMSYVGVPVPRDGGAGPFLVISRFYTKGAEPGVEALSAEALKYSFDQRRYFEMLNKIPSISAERAAGALELLREILGIVSDNAESAVRLKEVQMISAERERLRDILESIPAYVLLLTEDKTLTFTNGVFKKLFGEGEGKKCHEVMRKCGGSCPDCHIEDFLKNPSGQHSREWTDFRGRIYKVSDSVIMDSAGGRQVFVCGFDITEQKQAEQMQRDAKRMAEQAARVKTEFLANMSHEIRTPLNSIIGFSDILLDSRADETEKRKCLEIIKSRGEDLLVIIDDILDLSKIEAGKMDIITGPVSLRSFTDKISSEISRRAAVKNLSFQADIAPGLPETVLADETRLSQILHNLLVNAVKFTSSGCVRLSVSSGSSVFNPLKDSAVEFVQAPWSVSHSAPVSFVVSDTGQGIPKDHLARIFHPFAPRPPSSAGGAGLGLKICKKLVDLMGGSLWVESEEGKGSSFGFTLSLQIPDGPLSGVKSPCAGPEKRGGLNVLVVEDEESNMEFLKLMLEKDGHSVTAAGDGRTALEIYKERRFDIVFMDIQLPGPDGCEVTRIIRKSERHSGKHVPIIAVTAHVFREDSERCARAGMDGYLSKPVKINEIRDVIKKFTA